MRFNSLQFGKAMSAALFVLLLSVAGMKNALAQTQVATLQHGEDISVFYGTNAFVQAHNAAVDGDIVTLSGGTFIPADITKAITLRGAGCLTDSISGMIPTVIPGEFSINSQNDSVFFSCEGIYFTGRVRYRRLNAPNFIKCNFEKFEYWYGNGASAYLLNAQFVNCKFRESNFYDNTSNTTFINCVIWKTDFRDRTVAAYNSIIRVGYNTSAFTSINCILGRENNSSVMFGSSIAYNTIGFDGVFSSNMPTFNCMTVNSWNEVFETFTGESFSFEEEFILKEEIANSFLGNDGTQVGIHGGMMPYSSRPSYMVMKRCNVANKSTIDGKLSVEIEVVAEEE